MSADRDLREIAFDVLTEVLEEGRFIHQSLGAMLEKYQYLGKQERAFLTRLCEGCTERAVTLDYVINQYSKTNTGKMKPQIRTILRMGAYQILWMDGVPDAAACNEAVKLAQKKGFHGLKGFVNGVLRTISREKERIAWPSREEDPVRHLSVRYSTPEWLVERWTGWLGEEKTEEMLAASLEVPAMHIVVNTRKTTPEALSEALAKEGVTFTPDGDLSFAGTLAGIDHLAMLPAFQNGEFFVQDHSCTKAVAAAGITPGDTVIDLCAAPGGKSALAALLAGENGYVSARDISEEKCALIEENMARLGLKEVQVKPWDARETDPEIPDGHKVILADLPCSGLGVIRRKKDIKYHASYEGILSLRDLQREILHAAAAACGSGDLLLYSTCTVTREENEENARWFAQTYPFVLEEEEQILPGAEGDGFYYARFRCVKEA